MSPVLGKGMVRAEPIYFTRRFDGPVPAEATFR
jgi:hypothetical protein